MIRLLIVDDHALFREGVGRLLAAESDLEVVASCADLKCARAELEKQPFNLVLLDFDLGLEKGIDFVQTCRSLQPAAKVLILTAGVSKRDATDLIRSGVSGIFHKHNNPQTLSTRIRSVANGDVFLEEIYLKPLFQSANPEALSNSKNLTDRERLVLDLLLEGLSNKLIADKLKISEAAVKGALQQLFQKTGVRTRSQLVRYALENLK